MDNNFYHRIYTDRAFRTSIARESHYWFFHIYFPHYVTHSTAQFHRDMFKISEDLAIKMAVIVAFRGSGKSTLFTLSYPIWAMVGWQQKKFVILLSQTQYQARLLLVNIKRELETNELLRNDLGPFKLESDEWGNYSLVLPKYGARIIAASMEQSIRGLRHGQYRPDLIIADDVEDLASVKTKEGRDKTHQFITGEVIPAGDQSTRLIVIGNLLHEDSLLMRLKRGIKDNKIDGVFKEIPLIDDTEQIAWQGKFKDMSAIETLKRTVGNESSWSREYLLRIISDADRLVHPDWIQHYDILPDEEGTNFQETATGVDLAISQRDTADYTAMVSVKVFGYDDQFRIYVLPNPVNERLTFPDTVERIKLVSKSLGRGSPTSVYIEEVAYQAALIQHLQSKGSPAEGVKTGGQDKRARLAMTTHMIRAGKILFPRTGCEELIGQLTGFGVEKHDDLADAFAIVILQMLGRDNSFPQIIILDGPSPWDRYSPLSRMDEDD